MKFQILLKRNKTLYIKFSSSGLNSRFWLVMQRSFPEYQGGLAQWKVKSGDCVQDELGQSLFPVMESNGMEWEYAEEWFN
ncbi:MAG: hypothetical protein WBB27_12165 [Maribacter sp.]